MDRKFVQITTSSRTIEIPVAVASTPEEIARGLMGFEWLPSFSGMLFEMGKESTQSFWMKDTSLPLSIAFLNSAGVIVDIKDMDPNTTDPHTSKTPYFEALEVNQGFFEEHDIKIGDKIKVTNENAPIKMHEHLLYGDDEMVAHHEGFFHLDTKEIYPWNHLKDKSLIDFHYPRTLASNGARRRNHFGFKSLSFVMVSQATPTSDDEVIPKAPKLMRDLLGEKQAQKTFTKVWPMFKRHKFNMGTTLRESSRALDHFWTTHTPSQRKRAQEFAQTDGQHPIRLQRDLGFSRDASALATTLLSPRFAWQAGNGYHNNNVDAAIQLGKTVHLASTSGLDLEQSHIDIIQRNMRDHFYGMRKEKFNEQTEKIPKTPGKYFLDDLDDVVFAALMDNAALPVNQLKAARVLASERRYGIGKSLKLEDVAREKNNAGGQGELLRDKDGSPLLDKDGNRQYTDRYYTGYQSSPKVTSFFDNLKHPFKSLRYTVDSWGKKFLGLTHNLDKSSEDFCGCDPDKLRGQTGVQKAKGQEPSWDDFDTQSDRGRGAPRGDDTSFGKSAGYLTEEGIMHGSILAWMGRFGAGRRFRQTPAEEGGGRYVDDGDSVIPNVGQSLLWYAGQTHPTLATPEKRRLTAQLLDSSGEEIFRPDFAKEHDRQMREHGSAHDETPQCRWIHWAYERAPELARAGTYSDEEHEPSTLQIYNPKSGGGITLPTDAETAQVTRSRGR